MTTAVTNAATLAAFSERYRDRPFVLFSRQPDAIQARWRRVIDLIREGKVTSGRKFREVYVDGFPDMKAWTEIGRDERESWDAVFSAAQAAARRAELEELAA